MIKSDHVSWCHLIKKNEKYNLKNDKKWSCKLMPFNLKNEKCHLKNDKKWSCIAGFRKSAQNDEIIINTIYMKPCFPIIKKNCQKILI